jgi:hypothetical protein
MNRAGLGIGGDVVAIPAHIGLFYDGASERRRARLEFLRPAIEDRRQGIMLLAPSSIAQSARRDLEADLGGSLDSDVRSGRVRVVHYSNDPDLFLENIRGALTALAAKGLDAIRVFAQVAWGAPGFPVPEDHLWAESRINYLLAGRQVIFVCAYDVSQLPGLALVNGGLETHPSVVIGGRLSDSPSYLEPPEYMRSLMLSLTKPASASDRGRLT